MNNTTCSFKILLVGESGVGKSSLITRYLDQKFDDLIKNKTVGVEFFKKVINIDKNTINLHMWDTSGQKLYEDIVDKCYSNTNGFFVIFDISQKDSFMKAKILIESIRAKLGEKVIIILVGNKCDLNREITKEEAENLATEKNIQYIETSAKNNVCVDDLFSLIINHVCSNENIDGSNQTNNSASNQNNSNCIIE